MSIALADWTFIAIGAAAACAAYAALLVALVIIGRRGSARAMAGFVPDAAVLFGRLLRDGRVPRRRKLAVAAGACYLAMPLDLVPDFIPVAGHLDDAIVTAALLRYLVRGAGSGLIAELWPGPDESLEVVLRLGGHRADRHGSPPLTSCKRTRRR